VLRDFAARLHHLTNLTEDLALRTVRGRLARFLISEADLGSVDREWTQEEMAVRLGTVRDVIGRTLRSLEDEGLVRRERQQIILLDREALMEEAGI
jgi:CRP/FNR family transcriptional regulator